MKKVLIPTKLDRVAGDILGKQGRYEVVYDHAAPLLELAASHPETHALIVRSEKVQADLMDRLPSLRVIIRAGAGYNTIDTRHARKKGIDVMNTPGANANAVAEEVIAMILADARHLIEADPSTRAGRWEKSRFMGRELSHKVVGVVGLGAIGRMLVRRLRGFEVTVLGHDPMLSGERAHELGIELVTLEELFGRADIVSLHLPENDETRGLFDGALFGRMKQGATLVNCARAGIINEDDLRRAVAERDIHFLNDVYAKDAEGPKSVAEFARLMLPHLGASTREANENAARRAAEQLIEYDEKGVMSYVVNRDIPEGLDEAYCDLAHTLARLCRALIGRAHPLKLIETSFYGELKPFAKWLLVPIVAALDENFDRSMDHAAALRYLKELGIDYEDRETDDDKGFTNSITLDFIAHTSANRLQRVSIRGTVTEQTLMVSRIDDFHQLYFEPRGHTAIFEYADRPGVLGQIGAALARAGANIDDVRNPHDSRGERSIAILKLNRSLDAATIEQVAASIGADVACCVAL